MIYTIVVKKKKKNKNQIINISRTIYLSEAICSYLASAASTTDIGTGIVFVM